MGSRIASSVLSIGVLLGLGAGLFSSGNHGISSRPVIRGIAQPSGELALGPQPVLLEAYGKLPLAFEANTGQVDPEVKFLSRGNGCTLFLTASEAVLSLTQLTAATSRGGSRSANGSVLRMKLVGANPSPEVVGLEELPGKSNYFIGNDSSRWRTNVSTYGKVEYRDVYPGVSLVYYGNGRQLEHDFVVAPGANPGRIRVAIEGADKLELDPEGDLLLHASSGDVHLRKPIVYQETHGVRQEVAGSYILHSRNPHWAEVGFEVASYDATRPLVIDPVLAYSISYLGGADTDFGNGIAVDSAGNAYVTGSTNSTNFPTGSPFQGTNGGGSDAFVAKLNAAGSALVYSTYLGGSSNDNGYGIAVDSSGNAYVTGYTSSSNFPTASPLQRANAGGAFDAFVAKLDGSGSALIYSTYLGGRGDDGGGGIAVDAVGNAYVTGSTNSTNFPTGSIALQGANGGYDAFVAKLNAAGSALVYSTYLGGSGADHGGGIAVDSAGNAYVTGDTNSTNFPTAARPVQLRFAGGQSDGFVAKLNAAGSALVYSTYLGGSGVDSAYGIAVDSSGNAYVTGGTNSTSFPTASPLQGANAGYDAFVAKLDAAGSALVYSSYLGGSGIDVGHAIAVDSAGNAYVAGWTNSTNFTTVSPSQGTNGGGYDAFFAKLNASGSALVYSTCLGGSGDDYGYGIAVDRFGNAHVTGVTNSTNFPTVSALQATYGGGTQDAFVARLFQVAPAGAGVVTAGVAEGMPGETARVPVTLSLPTDVTLNTIRFGLTVVPNSSAPARTDPLSFEKDAALPVPSQVDTSASPNAITVTWQSLARPLSGTVRLGDVLVSIPGTAGVGQSYTVQLTAAIGGLDATPVSLLTGSKAALTVVGKANPPPRLELLSPSSALQGSLGFTLSVYGTNFYANSEVRWNGSSRVTSFVSATHLTALIQAGDVLATPAQVSVFNSTPGGGSSNALPFALASEPGPAVGSGATVNGASFTSAIAPGSIASVFGVRLAASVQSANVLPLSTALTGVSVAVNGIAAPLFFVSPTQINFQVPWEVSTQTQAWVAVTVNGVTSASESAKAAGSAPGLFAVNSAGTGQGAILIAATGEVAAPSGSIQGRSARPASRVEFITIYCTGLGPVTNQPANGVPALSEPSLSATLAKPAVTIGGVQATVVFSGLAPGFVGLYQVNVLVPAEAPTGNAVPVALTIGGVTSNTVTVAVQ